MYVAHVSDDGLRKEPVKQHLFEVAEMAAEFAAPFGGQSWAYAVGMLHDIGKYSKEFQKRILEDGPRVDHSTAGASIVAKEQPLLSYCIAGHHGGLPDGGVRGDRETTLLGRLWKADNGRIPDCGDFRKEIEVPVAGAVPLVVDTSRSKDQAYAQQLWFSCSFLTRMVFSCLVDADYLCTERFMLGKKRSSQGYDSLETLRDMLEYKLSTFWPPKTGLNEIRCGVLDDCLRHADDNTGVFTLTVPTGGGKTYSLMRFALQHATSKGKAFRRVIVAEPYTSIIEQCASVYREVFGDANVLEHHSNYEFHDGQDEHDSRLRLAAENWDAPVIVTTNVQLFESLFASKTSSCRKLHNIAGSVIVLDEAQVIPVQFLRPCVAALSELVTNYGCTVVLCTATQPAISKLFEERGLRITEIASDPVELQRKLKRVQYVNLGKLSDDELAIELLDSDGVLCVVNSRRQARALYERVKERAGIDARPIFHLSTLMFPKHRSAVIGEIRRLLKEGRPCIVVSTSLVEAGVDFDFPTVFRALSGIDSMVQAAGRCNREMRRSIDESRVYLFEADESYRLPAELLQRAAVSRSAVPELWKRKDVEDLDSIQVTESYFSELYEVRDLDARDIVSLLSTYPLTKKGPSIPFARVASEFRLIDEGTATVFVPTPENANEISLLQAGAASRSTMRVLGRYGVSIYTRDRDSLLAAGCIEPVGENVFILVEGDRYSHETGLNPMVEGGEAVFL